ncbi:MAG: inositol monophosphatase [Patescibacteria group bacterium]
MDALFKDALRIIRSTRALTLPHYGNVVEQQEKDGAHNVVTRLDFEVEEFLARELRALDPHIEFVGEEYGGDRSHEAYWLVDPIDGTMHFVRGIPFCTTMVALIREQKVVASAIYDFVSDTMYHATRGGGAYKNDVRIAVSTRPFSHSLSAIETQSGKPENNELYSKFRRLSKTLKTVTAGYELTLVASGKMEGRISFDPYGKDYDYAPGSLLVEEAGGVVQNIGTDTYDFRNVNFIAGNRAFVEGLTLGESALLPHTKNT